MYAYRYTTTKMSLPRKEMRKAQRRNEMAPFLIFQASPEDFHKIQSQQQSDPDPAENCNLLSKIFFHKRNLNLIQNEIRSGVFHATNGKYLVDRQNDQDVKVIMHAVYEEHSKNLPTKIKQQVRELDDLVVSACVEMIIAELASKRRYYRDINEPCRILDRPECASARGRHLV